MAYKVLDATSVSADTATSRCSMLHASKLSFQVIWTGTLTGTLIVQQSNFDDPDPGVASAHWENMAATFPENPAGTAGQTLEDFYESGARWIRVLYDHTSGSGTLKVFWDRKEVG